MAAAGMPDGPVALVTAGWEERELEVEELAAHLDRPVVNLRLYGRAEEALRADPEFLEAYRARRARMRAQSVAYRARLGHLVEALQVPERASLPDDLADAERDDALEMVRALDRHQAERVAAIQAEFEARWRPAERDSIAGHREAIVTQVGACAAVAIAGGHLPVLFNRLRLFDLGDVLRTRAVVAWSAGAMVLSERIVLFHDDPPQGRGTPEVFGAGLGLCPGYVFLPHARARLRLGDARRVTTLARRFAPLGCVALEAGGGLWCRDGIWHGIGTGVEELKTNGRVAPLELA
jgi:cyanophycinase-like exopeptidase